MRKFPIWSAGAVLSVLLAACGSSAAPASPAASSAVPASTGPAASQTAQASQIAAAPASGSAAAATDGWTRPTTVNTLPEAGIFKLVSETPSPGDKVPLFFMGAQG